MVELAFSFTGTENIIEILFSVDAVGAVKERIHIFHDISVLECLHISDIHQHIRSGTGNDVQIEFFLYFTERIFRKKSVRIVDDDRAGFCRGIPVIFIGVMQQFLVVDSQPADDDILLPGMRVLLRTGQMHEMCLHRIKQTLQSDCVVFVFAYRCES